ncbi:MAG: PfkB family carbohydrate kinase [Phycisphaerales bacterium]
MATRKDIATSAATKIGALARTESALVGFDGFIDSIIHMVDVRHDMSPSGYVRLKTISAFATRCADASGKSTNIEQVLLEDRFGGNGPLMAGGLAQLGMKVDYVGAVGQGPSLALHPVFAPFAARCRRVVPVAEPSTTDCLEFDDGKLMFNNTANVQQVTWERLVERVGLDSLRAMVDEAALLGIVNWSLLGGVPGIWRGLVREVLPRASAKARQVFIDLSDPAKRTDGDIRGAIEQLRELEAAPGVAVTLGLNLAESQRIASVLGLGVYGEGSMATLGQRVSQAAAAIRERLGLDCVVIHPREGAGAADASGASGWFDGPFTAHPKLSTGAGDHFNGGFAFAQVHGLSLEECLATGCAVSGAYVRDASSPTRERLTAFLGDLPGPE